MTKRLDYIPGTYDKIWQDGDEFSFTTDAVLLGNFPYLINQARVLDLGCGTGAVGMICARRGAGAVTALDINNKVLELLKQSILDNQLCDKFTVVSGDVKEYKKCLSNESFDLVVANPPYRVDGARRIIGRNACHEESATLEDFFRAAAFAVKFHGRFAIVQLPERFVETILLAEKYGLQPKKLQWVHSAADKPAWVFLLEMQKGGNYGLDVLPPKIGKGIKFEMKTIEIKGMHCEHCVDAVKKALEQLGYQRVQVILEENKAVIWDDKVDAKQVKDTVEGLGFDVIAIR